MNIENEIEKMIQDDAGEGARRFEEWLATDYKKEWHQVWDAGRLAATEGKNREENPHQLKVWKEVWWYGWDNYDPVPAEFRQVEQNLNSLPTRPMNEGDI